MSDLTRRDFINGSLMMAGTSMLPVNGSSQAVMAALEPSYYPPSLNGLRGSHPGSNDAAHARVWAKQSNWGPTSNLREVYDLVVVGGGISGLAAAYFYQQEHGRDKKILILDNHDDFGGHAKRNEHDVDGNILIGEGGSETIEQTGALSEIVLNLLKDLGLDLNRFQMTYDSNFFKKHGLGAATYFNQRVFGEDKVVRHPFGGYPGFMEGLLRSTLSYENAVEQAPLSKSGKQQLLRVLQSNPKTLNIPKSQWQEYVQTHTYFNYLKNTLGVDDPRVLRMARHSVVDYGGTPDVMTMQEALESSALGMDAVAWNEAVEEGDAPVDYIDKGDGTYASKDPFIHHFPDGNATIARMLVKKMVPEVGPGENVEEIVLSKFNYDKLDLAKNNVRIRLSSTVVNVKHLGNPLDSDAVMVNYIQGGESYQVKAKNTILACYNMMIPHIVSGLPQDQDEALRKLSKVPLQFSNVGLKNWRAMKEIGVGMAMSPGNMHQAVNMDFPVSVGGYEYTKSPDDPCILHMRCCLQGDTSGAPAEVQFREARYRMLDLEFNDYELEIREHLEGMFPKSLFDFDRDVQSITVNRWAHGYSYGNAGHVGRRPFGRITIANSDAVNSSLVQRAIDEAWRAVKELG
jgi:spermidine dehydrogenase